MIPNGSPLRNRLIASGYTPDQMNRLDAVLAETYYSGTYDYADSLRIARVANAEEVAEFRHVKEHGCCGEFERTIACADGDVIVGFNYGH